MADVGGNATATVLFSDLVGSTDLLAELGEAAFDQFRRRHFQALRAAVVEHAGQEIKTTGDGILAVFASAAAALSCAVRLQQTTSRSAANGQPAVAIRVGLAHGDVVFEDHDVFGMPVVQAARLTAAAQPGQILTTAVVPLVAGARASTTCAELGPMRLKGVPGPVAACQVAWEPADDVAEATDVVYEEPAGFAATAFTPRLRSEKAPGQTESDASDLDRPRRRLPEPPTSFVGRSRELADLDAQFGEARLVTLCGVGGVGKTRLAVQHALAVAGRYPDGVRLVGFASIRDPGLVVGTTATGIGFVPSELESTGEPLLEALCGRLAGRRMLLVLDNCEHLVEPVAALAQALLAECPQLNLLATSLEVLGIPVETIFQVPPLAVPDPVTADAETGQHRAARTLPARPLRACRNGRRPGQHPVCSTRSTPTTPRPCTSRPGTARSISAALLADDGWCGLRDPQEPRADTPGNRRRPPRSDRSPTWTRSHRESTRPLWAAATEVPRGCKEASEAAVLFWS